MEVKARNGTINEDTMSQALLKYGNRKSYVNDIGIKTEEFLFTTWCVTSAVCADTLSLSLFLSVNHPSIWFLQVLLILPVLVVQDITCQKFPMLDTLERLSLCRPLFVN